MSSARSRRATAVVIAALALGLSLAGCKPEPATTSAPAPSASASPSASANSTGSPSPTAQADAGIELPASCEQLYSPEMLAALQGRGPLNDPGVTMTSTQNVAALELLSSGVATIRCSWGVPSDSGMATNVTILSAEQSSALTTALAEAGFGCGDELGGTVCRSAQSMVSQDDQIAELTETHVFRGDVWISSYTINFDVPGYTEDVVATLWG
ncbi:hypothetical protein [Microbacterium lacus]|uniref:DUF4333 domain-containing protein n=1 Tax=Microbacterium lacus TaxID=415217 RepID=A0ABN2GFM9_9MICO